MAARGACWFRRQHGSWPLRSAHPSGKGTTTLSWTTWWSPACSGACVSALASQRAVAEEWGGCRASDAGGGGGGRGRREGSGDVVVVVVAAVVVVVVVVGTGCCAPHLRSPSRFQSALCSCFSKRGSRRVSYSFCVATVKVLVHLLLAIHLLVVVLVRKSTGCKLLSYGSSSNWKGRGLVVGFTRRRRRRDGVEKEVVFVHGLGDCEELGT